jgi:hypothetical protein
MYGILVLALVPQQCMWGFAAAMGLNSVWERGDAATRSHLPSRQMDAKSPQLAISLKVHVASSVWYYLVYIS